MSYPETIAVPLVGEMSPISMLNVVVLPAPALHTAWNKKITLVDQAMRIQTQKIGSIYIPFTPSKPKHSPAGIARLMPLTAALAGRILNPSRLLGYTFIYIILCELQN